MIGDGIATDLAAARAVGARCILMLTGVTTRAAGRGAARGRASDRGRRGRRGARRRSWRRLARLSSRQSAAIASSGIRRPGIERVAQRREVDLVGERHVERVTVDRPQLGQGQPDRLDRADVLLGQGDVGDRRVVRAQRDRDARPMEPGQRMRRDGRHDPGLPVRGRAQVEASRRGRSARRTAPGRRPRPVRGRSAPGPRASARRTCAAPPHSPAWRVIRRPPARAASNARGVGQRIREAPPRDRPGPSRSGPRRGTGRRSRPARRSPPGRATAAPCR